MWPFPVSAPEGPGAWPRSLPPGAGESITHAVSTPCPVSDKLLCLVVPPTTWRPRLLLDPRGDRDRAPGQDGLVSVSAAAMPNGNLRRWTEALWGCRAPALAGGGLTRKGWSPFGDGLSTSWVSELNTRLSPAKPQFLLCKTAARIPDSSLL